MLDSNVAVQSASFVFCDVTRQRLQPGTLQWEQKSVIVCVSVQWFCSQNNYHPTSRCWSWCCLAILFLWNSSSHRGITDKELKSLWLLPFLETSREQALKCCHRLDMSDSIFKDTRLVFLRVPVLQRQTLWRNVFPPCEMQSSSPLSPEHSQQLQMTETLRQSWW